VVIFFAEDGTLSKEIMTQASKRELTSALIAFKIKRDQKYSYLDSIISSKLKKKFSQDKM